MKISKYNDSPNDRFLIKIFIKIISLDSSQRVPPMSPCPPLIITRVCPWLINHLSDPWNFNKSNGILFRSNWRKPYPKFYGLVLLIIKGSSRKLARRYPPTFWGGVINPVLALFMTSYISLHGESKVIRPAWLVHSDHGHSSASGLRESCNSWAMLVVNVRGLPTPPDLAPRSVICVQSSGQKGSSEGMSVF